jgi:spermidine synthase
MTGINQSGGPSLRFTILHDSDTEIGHMLLRRRWSLALERDVFEMTMDGKLMMSDAVAISERALAERALALLPDQNLRLLIGGLGFGFTTRAALADSRVCDVTVVERLGAVIEWHRSGVLPWSGDFIADPRLNAVEGDFFELVAGDTDQRYDAILIDIDDSPSLLWHRAHAVFYHSTGLEAIRKHLRPGGVFGLWCATHPGDTFMAMTEQTFAWRELAEIHFENPCLRQPETNYILLAKAHHREKGRDGLHHPVS